MPPTRSRPTPAHDGVPVSTPGAATAVEVWHASLLRTGAELALLAGCLDAEEERRAEKFHAQGDRRRFRAARGLLRHILSTVLGTPPERIRFGYGPQGKPFLPGDPEVHFNLSHAGEDLAVVVARGRRVGIDVEQLIPALVMDEVLETVSSEPERALLLAELPIALRQERFARLWTRKEAYIKADGRGMAIDLRGVDVLSIPGRVRLLEGLHWSPSPEWTVRDLAPRPGLAAAVAVEGFEWRTSEFEWPQERR